MNNLLAILNWLEFYQLYCMDFFFVGYMMITNRERQVVRMFHTFNATRLQTSKMPVAKSLIDPQFF